MNIAVPKETFPNERRVALTPLVAAALAKSGARVEIEAGAGSRAGYLDEQYVQRGAHIVADRGELLTNADVVVCVRTLGANPNAGAADLELMRPRQVWIGLADPLGRPELIASVAERGVSLLALELVPRISRAQSMDVLSSQASIAGYRAVLLAATVLPKMFPMMTTAAGTITPAKVFVFGAGVAGLQAIATARRLGAVVSAYDVRAAVKEQVHSLGAKFVEMPLDTAAAEGQGGYAKAMDAEFYRRQAEFLGPIVAESDIVITTAAVPGKPAPRVIWADMVRHMAPGSVIVDLAAERGGNCELTVADQTVIEHGVSILGPTNLASDVAFHASAMFAKNVAALLTHLTRDGQVRIDTADEITRETLVAHEGRALREPRG